MQFFFANSPNFPHTVKALGRKEAIKALFLYRTISVHNKHPRCQRVSIYRDKTVNSTALFWRDQPVHQDSGYFRLRLSRRAKTTLALDPIQHSLVSIDKMRCVAV